MINETYWDKLRKAALNQLMDWIIFLESPPENEQNRFRRCGGGVEFEILWRTAEPEFRNVEIKFEKEKIM